MNAYHYDIINTRLVNLTIIFSDNGICRIDIGNQNPDLQIITKTPAMRPGSSKDFIDRQNLFTTWRKQLESYFQGEPVIFDIPVDIRYGTFFRQKVWRVLQSIPYGETRTYRWVAQQVGKANATRAVGQANAANQIPILIPCHRVIRSDGSLGGFSSGVNIKKELLRLEGVFTVL